MGELVDHLWWAPHVVAAGDHGRWREEGGFGMSQTLPCNSPSSDHGFRSPRIHHPPTPPPAPVCRSTLVLLGKLPHSIIYQRASDTGHPPICEEGDYLWGCCSVLLRGHQAAATGAAAVTGQAGLTLWRSSLQQKDPAASLAAWLPADG